MVVIDTLADIPDGEHYLSIDWQAGDQNLFPGTAMSDIYVQAQADDAFFRNFFTDWDNDAGYLHAGDVGNVSSRPERAYIRFPINLPRGSTIDAANFKITVVRNYNPEFWVSLVAASNCTVFPNGAGNETAYPVTDLETPSEIKVSFVPTGDGAFTIDIKTLLQEYINRSTYLPGNYMGIRIKGKTDELEHYIVISSYSGATKPDLDDIKYTPPPSLERIQYVITDTSTTTLTLDTFDTDGLLIGHAFMITKMTTKLVYDVINDYLSADWDQTEELRLEKSDSEVAIIKTFMDGQNPLDMIKASREIDGYIARVLPYRREEYQGVYTFVEDAIGSQPSGWSCSTNDTTQWIKVKETIHHHYTVLEYYMSSSTVATATNIFTAGAQALGTIEFWLMVENDDTCTSGITTEIRISNGANIGVWIAFGGGAVRDYNGVSMSAITNGIFYHFRIVFNCTPHTYNLYLDNVLIGSNKPFWSNQASLDRMLIQGCNGVVHHKYLDAVDYSWASGYTLNRNQQYKLTPFHYKGFLSFADETVGQEPSGFDVYYTDRSTYYNRIIAAFADHANVLDIYDNNAGAYAGVRDNFSEHHLTGTIEWYWGTSDSTKESYFQTYNWGNSNIQILLRINGGNFQAYNATTPTTLTSCSNNILYHIQVDWTASGWHIHINGTKYDNAGSDFALYGTVGEGMDMVQWSGTVAETGFHTYIDAIDYSWSAGYYANRNLEYYRYYLLYKPFSDIADAGDIPEDISDEGGTSATPSDSMFNLVRIKDRYGNIYVRGWNYTTGEPQSDSVTANPFPFEREKFLPAPEYADKTICIQIADNFLKLHAPLKQGNDWTLILIGDVDFEPGERVGFIYKGVNYGKGSGDHPDPYLITRKKYDSNSNRTELKVLDLS